MDKQNILIWLPSPMGDAIMSTAALRSIRQEFKDSRIHFLASDTVKGILWPNDFCDGWVKLKSRNPFAIARQLRNYDFGTAVLFKNSIASALAVFLAGIPSRIGYGRELRSMFLTDSLKPAKKNMLEYQPVPATDYYLALASWVGAETSNAKTSLQIDQDSQQSVLGKFSDILASAKPMIILVPGGAFGPSKCWNEANFAEVADYLIEKYDANVFVSVSPTEAEKQIAEKICTLAKNGNKIINLGDSPISLAELKTLFSFANLVITNDTGPRHIAIALGKKVITMFGPNNPAWTDGNYGREVQIIAAVDCAPCDKAICRQKQHYCMESITPGAVCKIADEMLNTI
ncbi:MAG: lipopolysaccharide heptosyltransferase II [Anaerohalosphaeraceae bacterium]|nr:lipopolysaccharide heptosyltransferase II [Anaerohalosphaeraceae bacterium]